MSLPIKRNMVLATESRAPIELRDLARLELKRRQLLRQLAEVEGQRRQLWRQIEQKGIEVPWKHPTDLVAAVGTRTNDLRIMSRTPDVDTKGFQQLSSAESGKVLQNPHHPRTNQSPKLKGKS